MGPGAASTAAGRRAARDGPLGNCVLKGRRAAERVRRSAPAIPARMAGLDVVGKGRRSAGGPVTLASAPPRVAGEQRALPGLGGGSLLGACMDCRRAHPWSRTSPPKKGGGGAEGAWKGGGPAPWPPGGPTPATGGPGPPGAAQGKDGAPSLEGAPARLDHSTSSSRSASTSSASRFFRRCSSCWSRNSASSEL